jgi:D-amino-acid dehydrogenase
MAEMKADVVVLGAGMVGVGAALHLQKRGRDVVLIDRHELAGEETSYGNGGLIECASVFPCSRGISARFSATQRTVRRRCATVSPICRFSCRGWRARYYHASAPERALASAMAELPLIRQSLIEHEALISEAGVPELLRRTGWIKLFRDDATLAKAMRDLERAKPYGVTGDVLDAKAIAVREPNLTGEFAGAVHFPQPGFVPVRRTGKSLCRAVRPQGRPFFVGDAERSNSPADAGAWRR